MKAFLTTFVFLFVSILLPAQHYFIRYDLATGTMEYLKVKKPGDTVRAAFIDVSKARQVTLRLENAAASYRQSVAVYEREELPETVTIPGIGSLPSLPLSSGLTSLNLQQTKPEELLASIFNIKTENKKSNNKSEDFEMDQTAQTRSIAMQKFTFQYLQFVQAYEQWRTAVLFEENCQVLWKELAGLRYNLQLTGTQVRQKARAHTAAVLPEITENPSAYLLQTKGNPQVLYKEVEKTHLSLQGSYQSLRGLDIVSAGADSLLATAALRMQTVVQNRNTTLPATDEQTLSRIATLYRQIMSDTYTRQIPVTVTRKTELMEIQFRPQIDSVTAAAIRMEPTDTLVSRWVTIYKKEPMRFRNTFGFSFSSFAENRWRYYVNTEGKIDREQANQYLPVVATFLNFYTPKDKGFRWGGSLGAGIPLNGDDKQLQILLGLSTFFGKNDPLCFTAGISGTQVKRLMGYRMGEAVSFTEIPEGYYNQVYRVGYFISISFNPAGLATKD